jgi:hypothetical protein
VILGDKKWKKEKNRDVNRRDMEAPARPYVPIQSCQIAFIPKYVQY